MATAREQAYLTLRRRLADGTYAPGSHLREEELAAQLGVSRTPVREALRRLDAEGWLRVVPNQGAFAFEWSVADIEEIFDLRALLEAHAVEHAATAPDQRGLDAMKAACELAERAFPGGDLAALEVISDANVRFHRAIWEMSGQARCRTILQSLAMPPMMLRNFRNFDAAGLRRSLDQHREMLTAIIAGNAAWAGAVMRAHVQAGRAVFLNAVVHGEAAAVAA
ncbi:GntR family transcriptional regulator [Roseococcus suduntuyensis]|uniref:DNA-binding GntR family transcriptional regulator n=1 Tax=Roseococcus suduntuyensis TaxID=455361 RepID=A0A840A6G1_9PROT|nr:GntR family transcriptional regulator [Roseococcus suduntuyensis]MBB3896717.1 DNA-binding GntR family transcriptional regulator [Roseococcus suduntuyensis]